MLGQRRRSGRFAYVLVLGAAAAVQALIGLQAWQHWGARDQIVAEKRRELGNIVQIVQHDVHMTIEDVDEMLSEIAARPAAASRFQPSIHDHAADHRSVSALFILDEGGRLAYSSAPALIDAAEFTSHPGFAHHRDGGDTSLHVGSPMRERIGGSWLIPVSRRIARADGGFGGVAVAAVKPDFLGGIYGTTQVGRDGAIILLHRDGTVLARVPHIDGMVGTAFANIPDGGDDAADLAEGSVELGASGKVEGLPLLVVATAGIDETLAAWKQGMQSLSLVSLLSAVVGVAFALLLIREFRRRDEGVSALAASESRFRDFAGTASDWLWESDEQHRVMWFSKRGEGGNPAEWMPALGKTRWDNERHETDSAKWAAHRDDLDNRRPFRNFEYWTLDRDGNRKHIRVSGTPVIDEHGRFRGYRGTSLDITAEVEARAEAERANARLLDAIESLSDGFALFNADDRLVICNRAFGDYHKEVSLAKPGRTFAETVEMAAKTVVHPSLLGDDPTDWLRWRIERHRDPGRPIEIKYRSNAWARVVENRTREGGIVLIRTDITEIKNREVELQTRVAQQNAIALLAQLALQPVHLDRLLAKATDLLTRTLNVPVSSVLELSSDGRQLVMRATTGWPREYVGRMRFPIDEAFQGGYTLKTRTPVMFSDPLRETRFKVNPMVIERGLVSGLMIAIEGGAQPFGILTTYSERANAFGEAEINFLQAVANVLANTIQRRQQEARLRAILDNSVDCIISIDEHGTIESANAAVERMFGFTEAELIGTNITGLMPEQYRNAHRTQLANYLATGESKVMGGVRELKGLRRDGTVFPVDLGVRELNLGSRRVFIGSIRDATQRKATEEQLRHAQKMEAVGQLTGGIAHDFNNLLTVILGNAELMQDSLKEGSPLSAMTDTVINAANRGAGLTQRLLAFARKQNLEATPIDLNELVLGMGDLLHRTLGAHVTVGPRLAADLPLALADRSQLESALLNLAINGRDAMAAGGVLTIETARAPLDESDARAAGIAAGDYVMLSVTDSGVGMTPEVLARAYEPFFTTKEVGKGTGLGLSMVYGFVKQSGGHVHIDSEIGRGTTVKIFLPPAPTGAQQAEPPESVRVIPGGRETVLVVEDDAQVRRLTASRLEDLGYRVVQCADGAGALQVIESAQSVDLLFSDVVMPGGLNGRQLAEAARQRRPNLRILLTSGYADGALADRAAGSETFSILTKPYDKRALAERIRAALG
jgi:PAS domain S-box-containing protein